MKIEELKKMNTLDAKIYGVRRKISIIEESFTKNKKLFNVRLVNDTGSEVNGCDYFNDLLRTDDKLLRFFNKRIKKKIKELKKELIILEKEFEEI